MSAAQQKAEAADSPERSESRSGTEQAEPKQTHIDRELKHERPLISCRFDPTGRFVFAGGEDNRIWRWDLADGTKTELAGHQSWVRAMAFHPDGQTLISGAYEGRLIWWPVADERPTPQRTVEAHKGWVRALAVSPDGSLVASAGNDNLVRLWRAEDGVPVRELAGHKCHVYNVAFHPGGNDLVSCDLKGNLLHWDVASGEQRRNMAAPVLHKYDKTFWADIGGARGMTFNRDGSLLAVSGITNVSNAFAGVGNPLVLLWDWAKGEKPQEQRFTKNIRGVAWGVELHPDGFSIAASGGGGGGYLLFWKLDQKDQFHELKLPDTARDMDMHPDSIRLATAHYDGHVRICQMAAKT